MGEQTEVERLTKEKAKINADLAAATELERQRRDLLPKLEAKWGQINDRFRPLEIEMALLNKAIQDIQSGTPTDYHLRRPRAKKSAEAE